MHHTGCGDGETRDSHPHTRPLRFRGERPRACHCSPILDSRRQRMGGHQVAKTFSCRDALLVGCRSPAADPLISCNLSRPRSVDLSVLVALMAVGWRIQELGGLGGVDGEGRGRPFTLLSECWPRGKKGCVPESIENPNCDGRWHARGSQEPCFPTRGAFPRGRMNPTTLLLPLNLDDQR